MVENIRLSPQTLRVIGALTSSGGRGLSGAEIGKETKLATGTLYPILFRLEEAGLLESEWEEGDPSALGRPRRRFYKVSGEGHMYLAKIAREITPGFGRPAWGLS